MLRTADRACCIGRRRGCFQRSGIFGGVAFRFAKCGRKYIAVSVGIVLSEACDCLQRRKFVLDRHPNKSYRSHSWRRHNFYYACNRVEFAYRANHFEDIEMTQLQSTITCPNCGKQSTETMPTDACQFFYDCADCGIRLKPLASDCCVFCSYGSVPCPPIQEGDVNGNCSEACFP